jgi:hypothetical protein
MNAFSDTGEYYFDMVFKWILLVFGAKMKLQSTSWILKLGGGGMEMGKD